MKKRLCIAIALAVLVGTIGCGPQEGQEKKSEMEKEPSVSGAEFWTFISETSPYTQWETWPGHPDMYPGKSPHGKYLMLYANKEAIAAAQEGKPMPDGAIIVKENYGEDKKTLMAVTPMYKVEGYNPEAGDWFWAKYGPDGTIMKEGKVEGCINCHKSVADTDWIFTKAE
jgi:hypothetical protein